MTNKFKLIHNQLHVLLTNIHLTVNTIRNNCAPMTKQTMSLMSWMIFWFVVWHKDSDPYFLSSCPILAVASAGQNVCLSLCLTSVIKRKWKGYTVSAEYTQL